MYMDGFAKVFVKDACSDSIMESHNELEAILNTDHKVLSIINIDIEFSLKCIVDQNTCFDANFVILRVPVSFVCDWYSVPSVWVHATESFSDALDDTLGEHVGFLVQMVMVGIWVVECSSGHLYHWLLFLSHLVHDCIVKENFFQHFDFIK